MINKSKNTDTKSQQNIKKKTQNKQETVDLQNCEAGNSYKMESVFLTINK